VWELPEQGRLTTALVAALLTFSLLAGASCSGDESGERTRSKNTGPEEGTLVSSTTGQEKTESAPPPEATLGERPDSPGIVLRLEGDPKTTFSGICTVGGKENVLSGRVPKRYAFGGQKLSCRIQKQDSGRGRLKVILTANDTTRSVQQTNTRGDVIHISYAGG
jgi:hypothetical protein